MDSLLCILLYYFRCVTDSMKRHQQLVDRRSLPADGGHLSGHFEQKYLENNGPDQNISPPVQFRDTSRFNKTSSLKVNKLFPIRS